MKQRRGADGQVQCYGLTPEGKIAIQLAPPLYGEVTSFIPKALFLSDSLSRASDAWVLPFLQEFAKKNKQRWGMDDSGDAITRKVQEQIRGHLEGMIIGPAMVALARAGVLGQLGETPVALETIPGNPALLRCLFESLAMRGWIALEGESVRLTPRGALRRADRRFLRRDRVLSPDHEQPERSAVWQSAHRRASTKAAWSCWWIAA